MPLTEVTEREIIQFIETAKRVLALAEKHDTVLFGEKGDDGLVRKVYDLDQWKNEVVGANLARSARIWEIAKPFLIAALSSVVTIAVLMVALHAPAVAALFGLKVAP